MQMKKAFKSFLLMICLAVWHANTRDVADRQSQGPSASANGTAVIEEPVPDIAD